MTTFEEQFPSLKHSSVGKCHLASKLTAQVRIADELPDMIESGNLFPQKDIEAFCLDKQKVREAIKRVHFLLSEGLHKDNEDWEKLLLKELGL